MALGKLGKYERVDVLGHGASGIVYLAWDTLLKKQIALKEIDLQAADLNRFLEEARVMDRLSHPNIVRVNGVDKIDGHVVIDMEYVKGRNLQQILRQEGPLPVDRALDIAIEVLDALDYAHRMRTVHRDIKPANILVSKSGEVKLVDFGLAEILATNSYAGGAGTYAYMAPEDFAEDHHSDHQSDIWAMGVTLYEMVTGARPFNVTRAKDPFSWRKTLLNEDPIPLAASAPDTLWPEGLQAVMDRALARDKSARYQTAGEFRDDLTAVREGVPASSARSVASLNGNHVSPEREQAIFTESPLLAKEGVGGGASASAPTLSLSEFVVTASPPPLYAPESQRAEAAPADRRGFLGRKKQVLPARVIVEPQAVHFGEVRKGDERASRIQVQFDGGDGRVTGRVVAAPPWATVYPPVLTRKRQALTVTAHSDRTWQIGDFEDQVRLETSAGSVSIPVTLRVLKPRRTFAEVAIWFVPLVISVLLPALTIAWGSHFPGARYLVPAAALGSGLLSAMLLLVSVEGDLGVTEKIACGILLAAMTMVLGVTVGVSGRMGHTEALARLPATGVPIGAIFLIQLMQRRYWKLWACAIALLSLLTSAIFVLVLSS
jgi:serine/threonine protein kinase